MDRFPASFRCERSASGIRSNLFTEDDIDSWMKEYEAITNTYWDQECTDKNKKHYVWRKQFRCRYSIESFPLNEDNLFKNTGCKAKVIISIKMNHRHPLWTDRYVKKGMPAIIKVHGIHNHQKVLISEADIRKHDICLFKNDFLKYLHRLDDENLIKLGDRMVNINSPLEFVNFIMSDLPKPHLLGPSLRRQPPLTNSQLKRIDDILSTRWANRNL